MEGMNTLASKGPRGDPITTPSACNPGLLLHYQSHADNRYKNGLLRTILDRAHRLSSSWSHFSDECDRLKTIFSGLKYSKHLVNSTIKSFVDSKVCDQKYFLSPAKETDDTVRVILPFKDQNDDYIYYSQSILIEPPKMVKHEYYICSNKFYLDPIIEMYKRI